MECGISLFSLLVGKITIFPCFCFSKSVGGSLSKKLKEIWMGEEKEVDNTRRRHSSPSVGYSSILRNPKGKKI